MHGPKRIALDRVADIVRGFDLGAPGFEIRVQDRQATTFGELLEHRLCTERTTVECQFARCIHGSS